MLPSLFYQFGFLVKLASAYVQLSIYFRVSYRLNVTKLALVFQYVASWQFLKLASFFFEQ
jgi:hypothetical protein